MKRKPWTEKETKYLLAHKQDKIVDLCKALNFDHSLISKKRVELGIVKPRHKWTEEENELIRITPVSQTKELAKRLGVTPNALSKRRKKLGLAKTNSNWTMAEIDFIKKNAKKMSNQELLEHLPNQTVRTRHTISSLKEIKNVYGIVGGKKSLKGKPYDDFELRIIKSKKYTNKQASLHTGRTIEGIKKKRTQLRKEGIISW